MNAAQRPGRAPAGAWILAPAKLNLGLRVVGRRPDGYHAIESLFVPIDLADEVRVDSCPQAEARVELELEDAPATVPRDEHNLAVRAAWAFLGEAAQPLAVRVRLRKRVPAGAGLGGGSSDAGAVLRSLARQQPGALPRERLAALALTLGADVPFFLEPRPAWVSGIGEHIAPVEGLLPLAFLLVTPPLSLSTAEVYRRFDAQPGALTPTGEGFTIRELSGLRDEGSRIRAGMLARLLVNDLEPTARQLCPAIRQLRARLGAAGALAVGMSGSGPTMFGVFEHESAAETGRARLGEQPGDWVRVASGLGAPVGGSG